MLIIIIGIEFITTECIIIAMHSFSYLVIIVTNHNNFNFHDTISHFEPGLTIKYYRT